MSQDHPPLPAVTEVGGLAVAVTVVGGLAVAVTVVGGLAVAVTAVGGLAVTVTEVGVLAVAVTALACACVSGYACLKILFMRGPVFVCLVQVSHRWCVRGVCAWGV